MSPPDGVRSRQCQGLPPLERARIEKASREVLDQFYLAIPETVEGRDLFIRTVACDLAQVPPLRASGVLALLGAKDEGLMQQILQRLETTAAPDQWSAVSALLKGHVLTFLRDPKIDGWSRRYFQAAVYLALQKGRSVGQLFAIPGVETPLRVGGLTCYTEQGYCDLLVDDGRVEMAARLRQSFSSFDRDVRQRAVQDYQSLAVSFSPEDFAKEAYNLGKIADEGTKEAREAAKSCQYFLASLTLENRRLSTPATKTFDPSLHSRPLRPEEFPKD